MTPVPTDRDLELAWVSHLLGGGTTGWREFRAAPGALEPSSWTGLVPGAQNLELLRRLNLTAPIGPDGAREVLHASLPGRGRPDLRLIGHRTPAWGFPPVDPAELPAADLLRVLTGFLAHRLHTTELPQLEPVRARRWARQFELAGNPWQRAQYLDQLRSQRRTPGGPAAHVLVLVTGLDQMLAAQWAWRAHRDPITTWPHWQHLVRKRGRLPLGVDPVQTAQRAAARVGRRRVHIVLDPSAVADLTGARTLATPAPLPSAAAADLARQVSTALVVRTSAERRHRLMWEVFRQQAAGTGGGQLRVSPGVQEWLGDRAAAMSDQLRAAGYPVHGDLSGLAPTTLAADSRSAGGHRDEDTVELGMKMLRQLVGAGAVTTTDIGE